LNIKDFIGTNLVQLSWIFPALVKAERNLYLQQYLVAQKAENTGGYMACGVFGVNMQRIFSIFRERGISSSYFNIISRTLLVSFIPGLVLSLRKNLGSFKQEDFLETLTPVYRFYPLFWFATYPVLVLPQKAGKIWHKMCKLILRLARLPFRFQT
jgi:hypothetical protein